MGGSKARSTNAVSCPIWNQTHPTRDKSYVNIWSICNHHQTSLPFMQASLCWPRFGFCEFRELVSVRPRVGFCLSQGLTVHLLRSNRDHFGATSPNLHDRSESSKSVAKHVERSESDKRHIAPNAAAIRQDPRLAGLQHPRCGRSPPSPRLRLPRAEHRTCTSDG